MLSWCHLQDTGVVTPAAGRSPSGTPRASPRRFGLSPPSPSSAARLLPPPRPPPPAHPQPSVSSTHAPSAPTHPPPLPPSPRDQGRGRGQRQAPPSPFGPGAVAPATRQSGPVVAVGRAGRGLGRPAGSAVSGRPRSGIRRRGSGWVSRGGGGRP